MMTPAERRDSEVAQVRIMLYDAVEFAAEFGIDEVAEIFGDVLRHVTEQREERRRGDEWFERLRGTR